MRQGREEGTGQSSWYDGRTDEAQEDEAYSAAKEIAQKVLNKQASGQTGRAQYFLVEIITPEFSAKFVKTTEARVVIEGWRRHYNSVRPHSSLNNMTPEHFCRQYGKNLNRGETLKN